MNRHHKCTQEHKGKFQHRQHSTLRTLGRLFRSRILCSHYLWLLYQQEGRNFQVDKRIIGSFRFQRDNSGLLGIQVGLQLQGGIQRNLQCRQS